MFCPQCGAAPTPGGRFCGSCGTLLPFAPLAAVTVGGPSAPKPQPGPAPTSLLRGVADRADARTTAARDREGARADPQGPMGTLLAPARRHDRADAQKLR